MAAHVPPTRRLAASVTRRPGSESGACVAARLSFDRPPSLHSLRCRFVVGFVRGFIGTTQPSDSSRLPQQLRLLDFLSWPGIALATAGGVRSPRFRRDPFIRDVASDPGRATVPCVTAPHMLPSAVATASAPATSRIYRGRNVDCSTPPAQIRACPIKALGSYLEWMTRNRWSGHGCCRRTGGTNRTMSRLIRSHVNRCR